MRVLGANVFSETGARRKYFKILYARDIGKHHILKTYI
jgi:hypothetical protein